MLLSTAVLRQHLPAWQQSYDGQTQLWSRNMCLLFRSR